VKQQTGIGNMQTLISINDSLQASKSTEHDQQMTVTDKNNHQSNLVKGGITFCFYLPGGSNNLQLDVLAGAWGFDPPNLPFPCGFRTPSKTVCHWTQQVYLPHGI